MSTWPASEVWWQPDEQTNAAAMQDDAELCKQPRVLARWQLA